MSTLVDIRGLCTALGSRSEDLEAWIAVLEAHAERVVVLDARRITDTVGVPCIEVGPHWAIGPDCGLGSVRLYDRASGLRTSAISDAEVEDVPWLVRGPIDAPPYSAWGAVETHSERVRGILAGLMDGRPVTPEAIERVKRQLRAAERRAWDAERERDEAEELLREAEADAAACREKLAKLMERRASA